MRRLLVAGIALAMAIAGPGAAAVPGKGGFRTSEPSMLTAVKPGVKITPLLTVGDELPNGFTFEAVPDGIAVRPLGSKMVDVYVNHETSKSPFPYNPALMATDPGESQNDFDNAQVSQLTFNTAGWAVEGSFAITSDLGYQRFCSNFLATESEGFERDILFTNEESPDYFLRQEESWPPALDDPNQEEAGLVVALDVESGEQIPIYGMGRHNHENAVAIPGFEDLVVLSGDDTFTSGALTGVTFPEGVTAPAQSQLYSYIASDTDTLLEDDGELWAFVSDDPSFDDYYDFTPGSTQSVSGHFIAVPENIATGLNPDGSEMKAADVPAAQGGPFPPPPNNGSWQRDIRSPNSPQDGIDGPQWVLEYWSDINNVFQFVRVEDIAYDKRPGMGNVVYVVDSGRGTSGDPMATRSTNGRVWRMELDPEDPTLVTSLTVFVEGDDSPVKTPSEVHQPDNIETTSSGILLTEDPGSSQQFPADSTDPAATTGRIWYVPFSGAPQVVAKVNQSADEGPTDVDPPDIIVPGAMLNSPGNLGAWEASGIVDASAAFGNGAFLVDVQAHTLWVESETGEDNDGDGVADFTYKREGGQLLLIRIPGI